MAAPPGDVGQVLMQRSAERDVEGLGAAADAQHRQLPVQRRAEQGELPRVPVGCGRVGTRVRRLPVARRVDVSAAGDHQAVEPVEHPVRDVGVDRLRWQQHRDATGQRDALKVDRRQKTGAHVQVSALRLIEISGQTDERPNRATALSAVEPHASLLPGAGAKHDFCS